MKRNYEFRIEALRVEARQCFQLRVGLAGEPAAAFVPVYRSAFAKVLPVQPAHTCAAGPQIELTVLLAWMEKRAAFAPAKPQREGARF